MSLGSPGSASGALFHTHRGPHLLAGWDPLRWVLARNYLSLLVPVLARNYLSLLVPVLARSLLVPVIPK